MLLITPQQQRQRRRWWQRWRRQHWRTTIATATIIQTKNKDPTWKLMRSRSKIADDPIESWRCLQLTLTDPTIHVLSRNAKSVATAQLPTIHTVTKCQTYSYWQQQWWGCKANPRAAYEEAKCHVLPNFMLAIDSGLRDDNNNNTGSPPLCTVFGKTWQQQQQQQQQLMNEQKYHGHSSNAAANN